MTMSCRFWKNIEGKHHTLVQIQGEAEKRLKDDFDTLDQFSQATLMITAVPHISVILQALAVRYFAAGILDPEFTDKDYPLCSSKQLSCICWNLGNWCRSRFSKFPLPDKLQKFEPRVSCDMKS